MEREVWHATVHWVAKSWTQLSDWAGTHRITSSMLSLALQGSWKKEKEEGTENLFEEIMAENLCNLAKEMGMQVQEAQKEFQTR